MFELKLAIARGISRRLDERVLNDMFANVVSLGRSIKSQRFDIDKGVFKIRS